ncbi:MAG: TetR/AcrR family transcriptional regulator [Ilumatobacteraceae bacterium]
MPKTVDIDVRRREIVDAAARLIARGGMEAATMRDIAAEAGWTTGVVNHYFADKRAVLRETLEHSIRQRRARRPADGPPREQLRAELAVALPLDEEGRKHWLVTLAFCSQAAGDPELALVQRDAYRAFRARIARFVGAEQAEHLIATIDGIALQAMFDLESWPASRQLAMLDALLATT